MDSPDRLLESARFGNAVAAADLWRAIASGEASQDVALAWLADVAGQVVAKVLGPETPANRRPDAALKALGLEGRLSDPHASLRRALEVFDEFDNIADPDAPPPPRIEEAKIMQQWGYLQDKPLHVAVKTIDRLRKK